MLRVCAGFGLLMLLVACGDETSLNLRTTYPTGSTARPDLVLLIRMDDPGGGLDPNSVIEFVPQVAASSFPGTYNANLFSDYIRGCAMERSQVETGAFGTFFTAPSSSCVNLAQVFGQQLFQNQAVELETETTSIKLASDTRFIFVLYFFGASNLSYPNRCLQIQTVQKVGKAFKVKSGSNFTTVSTFSFELPAPVTSGSVNCFAL